MTSGEGESGPVFAEPSFIDTFLAPSAFSFLFVV
jgi:hypothetical protein